jgi:sodium/pantothenate symporter
MSIWSGRITKEGAFWTMIAGFVFNGVPSMLRMTGVIYLPSCLDPILLGAVASLVTTVGVSRPGTVTPVASAYFERLPRTPAEDLAPRKTRGTLVALLVLVGLGCVMPLVMQRWYVLPYQRGTGAILPDGSINRATGEALLSRSYGRSGLPSAWRPSSSSAIAMRRRRGVLANAIAIFQRTGQFWLNRRRPSY